MPTSSSNLFLIQDLDDPIRTRQLADRDLNALRTVADWIGTFIVRPNEQLGRAGPVCPFVPIALERSSLWLAPEKIADRNVPDVVDLMNAYKEVLLRTEPSGGDGTSYTAIVVVFTDLSPKPAGAQAGEQPLPRRQA